jgi:asparagine synthetase B (glutamine-hydrolysing)
VVTPYVRLVDDGAGALVSGTSRARFGHRVPGGAHGQDGVFAEWYLDGDRLVVETDRYGMYPLFVHASRREILVSPSIPTLLERGAPRALDVDALCVFLHAGFFLRDETPFRGIRAVPPGGRLEWTRDGLRVERAPVRTVPIEIDRTAAIDAYVELFRQAMRRRPPHGRVAVPLSGGRDSRHILFELTAGGHVPDACVTVRYFPPRSDEDVTVAGRVAAALGLRHVVLEQGDEFAAEEAKNAATSFCADEHAWFAAVGAFLDGRYDTVYDGIGGDVLSGGLFLTPDRLARQARARYEELAEDFLLPRYARTLSRILARELRPQLSRARARERIAVEMRAHADAANPIGSFCFWNRTRREIALAPYALGPQAATVYAPYLDHDLYDFLSALPAAMLVDRRFHTAAIGRAFPEHAHLAYEDPHRRGPSARRQDRRFAAALLQSRWIGPSVRAPWLAPGLRRRLRWAASAPGALRPRTSRLEPRLALYLCQLAAAGHA